MFFNCDDKNSSYLYLFFVSCHSSNTHQLALHDMKKLNKDILEGIHEWISLPSPQPVL